MVTELELKEDYLQQHSDLEFLYYAMGSMDKATFDTQHGQLWKNFDVDMIAAGFRLPPVPPRDMVAEFDELKAKVLALEAAKEMSL